MMVKDRKIRKLSVFSISLVLFIVMCGVTLSYYLFVYLPKIKPPVNDNSKNTADLNDPNKWIAYERKDYGYLIEYPPKLIIHDRGNNGGYVDFVRLDAPLNSDMKGIGIGISSKLLKDETQRIKDELKKEDIGILVEEKEFEYKGVKAVRLFYKPKDTAYGEERVIVVFRRGAYTYSISTSPDQIDKVLETFSFI